ncbi:hypothetical protein WJX75_000136 [Coccomyxa subellipsoidea]|uniref:Uncharacterized protein n=1 Tax=Coccomyxa subellipsoidea TaxID=248742 RepID=A0ABR2Z224_9CHLO
MAGQGAYIPSVAIAGAPPEFIAPPAAIPTADAVGPQDVIAAARYKKAVKQLRGITGGAIVTVQEEADVTCNHLKAVAAHAGPYPATATELRELTHNRLDLLAAFYNEHFGVGPADAQPGQPTTPILQRRRMFALFIGFPRP